MPTKTKTLKFEIANADEEMTRFLYSIVTLFTDPNHIHTQQRLRDGRYVLKMAKTGYAQFEDQDAVGGFKSVVPPSAQ